jgi:hypothetical protein
MQLASHHTSVARILRWLIEFQKTYPLLEGFIPKIILLLFQPEN